MFGRRRERSPLKRVRLIMRSNAPVHLAFFSMEDYGRFRSDVRDRDDQMKCYSGQDGSPIWLRPADVEVIG